MRRDRQPRESGKTPLTPPLRFTPLGPTLRYRRSVTWFVGLDEGESGTTGLTVFDTSLGTLRLVASPMTRHEIREALAELTAAPRTRTAAEELLRTTLHRKLGVTPSFRWDGVLHVNLPTRVHYALYLDEIETAIGRVTGNIVVSLAELSEADVQASMRSLRNG